MINVNQITSRLASMPDQALQQYAAMHKNDPYTMALALSESNRRKQMRQGAQMQAQQQPKVVDQEIAGMAQAMPEDVGIGQLPAPNMQRMAEGGIVAFEGGGEVPRYYDGVFVGQGFNQTPLIPPPAQNRNALIAGKSTAITAQAEQEELRKIEEALLTAPPGQQRAFLENRKNLLLGGTPSAPAITSFPAPKFTPGGSGKRTAPPQLLPPLPDKNKSPLDALVQKPAAPLASAAPAGLATTPEAVSADMATMQARQKTENPFAKQIEDLTASERDALTKEKEQFEADIAKAGPAFKDREERLKKRGEKLESQEGKLPYMALMEAGLAIMSGTSPNALTNIGAGSAVGLKSYTAGLDKLTEARDKLDDAFGKIEEYRRNEDSMNAKEKRSMQRSINNTYTKAKELGLAALQKDWELDRTDANKQFDVLSRNRESVYSQTQQNIRSDKSEAGAMARAKMQLGAPPAEARMAMMLGTGKTEAERLESGLRKVQDLQSDKSGMAAVKLLTETNKDRAMQGQQPITMEDLMISLREYQTLMRPKIADVPTARERPVK
jgi:hypothetical protein